MRQNLYSAVFAAGITLVLTCLMIGVKLTSEGTQLKVVSATEAQWGWIFAGIALVFLSQLFRDQIGAATASIPRPDLAALMPQREKAAGSSPG
ncbi:DUF3382 domain-containing protein [Marinobacterium aestuariivivens]|uniref:DUF3382 domain-containing protein n=1 Tax=Marinobacterium aestuariivivens TaxID=1698799 RepID=A0ABW2A1I9_9GAMM